MKRHISSLLVLLVFSALLVVCTPNTRLSTPTETVNYPPASGSELPDRTDTSLYTALPMDVLSSPRAVTTTPDWAKMIANNRGLIEEIENTPNCRLPCWWGIIPGETEWKDVEARVSRNAIVSLRPLPNGDQQGDLIIPVSMKAPPNFFSVKMKIESGVVQQIEVESYRDSSSGGLRAFLVENGKPDEIWVHSYYHNLGGPPPFHLWLFYWQKGMAAYFYDADDKSGYENGQIKACIEEGPVLYLWDDSLSSLSELKNGRIDFLDQLTDPNYPILPIEDAIGMNLEQFYQEYRDREDLLQPACFTSDRSLWPEP